MSAYPSKAILLSLFLEVYHSSEVLLPSTDFYISLSAVTNGKVRMGCFHGKRPELKQLCIAKAHTGQYMSLISQITDVTPEELLVFALAFQLLPCEQGQIV